MNKVVLLILLFLTGTLITGFIMPGSAMADTEYPDLTGQKLVVYVTFHEEEGRRLLDLFQEKTNCKYTYLRMPAGETGDRVIEEAESPAADIVLGGPADVHQMLANKGLLVKYISPVSRKISSRYQDPSGYWTGIYIGPIAIAINEVKWKKEFADKGVKKPETFNDLLNSAFQGQIIMPDPRSSGTGYTIFASLIQLWGQEKALDFFNKLDKNVAKYTKSGFTPAQKVAVGEYLIGIDFLHDQLLMRKFGFNISSRIPEGAGWEIGSVSIIKNSPNPESARAFIDFMLGREAGQLHTDLTERISTRSDVRMSVQAGKLTLAEMPINWNYDFSEAAAHRLTYQQLWEDRIYDNSNH